MQKFASNAREKYEIVVIVQRLRVEARRASCERMV